MKERDNNPSLPPDQQVKDMAILIACLEGGNEDLALEKAEALGIDLDKEVQDELNQ